VLTTNRPTRSNHSPFRPHCLLASFSLFFLPLASRSWTTSKRQTPLPRGSHTFLSFSSLYVIKTGSHSSRRASISNQGKFPSPPLLLTSLSHSRRLPAELLSGRSQPILRISTLSQSTTHTLSPPLSLALTTKVQCAEAEAAIVSARETPRPS